MIMEPLPVLPNVVDIEAEYIDCLPTHPHALNYGSSLNFSQLSNKIGLVFGLQI
jgi:hypothetical protein